MEEKTPPRLSTISILKQGSRGSTQFLTTLNKMGLQRGIIEPSSRQPKRSYMIRVYL
jgi:hypothetical protein